MADYTSTITTAPTPSVGVLVGLIWYQIDPVHYMGQASAFTQIKTPVASGGGPRSNKGLVWPKTG